MAEGTYGETIGILTLVFAVFVGAYYVDNLVLEVTLAILGVSIIALWIFRYIAEGMADSG